MKRRGRILDRLEIAAAGIWLAVALVALGNARLSLLPAAFLIAWGAVAGLLWLGRSAALAGRGAATPDRLRRLRWYGLPVAVLVAFGLGRCAVGPMLRLRFALSESALDRWRGRTGSHPRFETYAIDRRVGLFWVHNVWTDGTCWTFITGSWVYEFHGLKYCRPGSWSGGSDVEDLRDGWYAWHEASNFN